MKITGIFNWNGKNTYSGITNYQDNIQHKVGQILFHENDSWEVVAVSKIFQGCFGIPKIRRHNLILKPINHTNNLVEGDILFSKEDV